jgi:TolB protein
MLSMPNRPAEVLFRDWHVLKVEYVVIGRTEMDAAGNLSVSYYLFDVLNERQLATEKFTAPPTALRDMAHLVSDAVYEKLTGIPGAFSTRIIYVLARDFGTPSAKFNLEMADADGARPPRASCFGCLGHGAGSPTRRYPAPRTVSMLSVPKGWSIFLRK